MDIISFSISNITFNVAIFLNIRQVLPVITKADRGGITAKIIKKLPWWPQTQVLKLITNMRVIKNGNTIEDQNFCKFLLEVGEGKMQTFPDIGTTNDVIRIPDEYIFGTQDPIDLIKWVYPDLINPLGMPNVDSKAILCATNKNVDMLNDLALGMMSNNVTNHISADSVVCQDSENETVNFPVEFLHSLNPPGMAPHKLALKRGAPIILLRNLDPKRGLCNGTRLIVESATNTLLTVKITNGSHAGQLAYIPRIDLCTAEGMYPFIMKRRQFPVKLAFAMTINKAQGQSLTRVGIYLPLPVFAHGQLYVALSRAGIPSQTKILIVNVPNVQGTGKSWRLY